jgi:hypothetical protein
MKSVKLLSIASVIVTVAAVGFFGCKGDQGPAGPAGRNPQGPPIITTILAIPDSVGPAQTSQLVVAAYDPNGDSMSYMWTASAGTIASPNAATTVWTAPDSGGLVTFHVAVSAKGETTTDSVRVGVNMAVPSNTARFLGNDGAVCGQCHSAIAYSWSQTIHASAWDSIAADTSNLYCVQCHTTGFGDRYDASGNLVSTGPHNGGFDDHHDPSLRNVQCESCHGPMGPAPLNHLPNISNSLNGQTCSQCHPAWPEYIQSGHYTAVARRGGESGFLSLWGNATCDPCHVSEGFLRTHDTGWMAGNFAAPDSNPVICATCHNPHTPTPENEEQLRTVGPVTTPYGGPDYPNGYTISGWGNGQLCVQCHHARPTLASIQLQFAIGSQHPGPHDGPQAEMFVGYGDYELPGPVLRMSQHLLTSDLPDVCVDCHIVRREFTDPGGPAYGHTFMPQLSKCQQCHPLATDFNIGGVQDSTHALLDTLAAHLPHDSTGNVMSAMDTTHWTLAQREAGYTYFFVMNDGSYGVHNRDYAWSVLRNAINSLP